MFTDNFVPNSVSRQIRPETETLFAPKFLERFYRLTRDLLSLELDNERDNALATNQTN